VTAASAVQSAAKPSRRGWIVTLAVLALVLASLWYGHAPPRSAEAYDKQAGYTTAFLESQLRTAMVWSRQHQEGMVTGPATVVAVDEAVKDATTTLDRFTGYLPPRGRDGLRTRISDAGSSAVEELGLMRVAAQRGDWAALYRLAHQAEGTAAQLSDVAAGLPQ
jgi:hypothetical protein